MDWRAATDAFLANLGLNRCSPDAAEALRITPVTDLVICGRHRITWSVRSITRDDHRITRSVRAITRSVHVITFDDNRITRSVPSITRDDNRITRRDPSNTRSVPSITLDDDRITHSDRSIIHDDDRITRSDHSRRDSSRRPSGGTGFASRLHSSIRKVDSPAGVVRYVHSVTPSPNTALKNAKVYMLISNRTISAGEHLAFVLKQTHRATLIGETTRGAGNVETDFPMPDGFSAVIPFGRAFDPKTGEGWEQVGVKPDIRVPAAQALDKALKLAGLRKSAKAALDGLR